MLYSCCEDRRRNAVRQHPILNGIDYLEVPDNASVLRGQQSCRLFIHCIKPLTGLTLSKELVKIEGGERIRDIVVTAVSLGEDTQSNVLAVEVSKPGDLSVYKLRLLVQGIKEVRFDPLLTSIDFTFQINRPNDFDCQVERSCPPEPQDLPEISYMAKDYLSFRQLMLDRMAVTMPQWNENSPADLELMLVELFAYVADQLSYQQDVIATEAYLGTARRRISVRRHARLLDYFMSEGSNARVWLQVAVREDIKRSSQPSSAPALSRSTMFLTQIDHLNTLVPLDSPAYREALALQPTIFEAAYAVDNLFEAHNEMQFYTWGARECCLPKGATQATLLGHFPNLQVGDVLIFEEIYGPYTGEAEDADIAHRCAVRLTKVNCTVDPLGKWFTQAQEADYSLPVTEIEWHIEDALPFPLCISATTAPEHGLRYIENVSVAHGNIVLADHGHTMKNEAFAPVPAPLPYLFKVPASSGNRCQPRANIPVLPRFYPSLQNTPLTHVGPSIEEKAAVSAYAAINWAAMNPDMVVLPAIILSSTLADEPAISWQPVRGLLNSDFTTPAFVVEIESNGATYLRFGDGRHGMFPQPGTQFAATYRVGNGAQGNIGADSLTHIVGTDTRIVSVRNPLPAKGGREPESVEDVRQKAPGSFLVQARVVTADDYITLAKRDPEVRRAAAVERWTGSWYTTFLAVERSSGAAVDSAFKDKIRLRMERYRLAGSELVVVGPVYVSLEIAMTVTVNQDYFRNSVKAALMDVFSNRILPTGERGVFYADNFTFGQPVYISPLRSAALAVPGVDSVNITRFQRQGYPSQQGFLDGALVMGWMEIARLENDPDSQEHGLFHLNVEGGK